VGEIKSGILNFQSVPGLTDVKKRLITSVKEGMVAHALLFQGKPGALGLPLALAYANYLHCQNRKADDACGECSACVLSKKHIHPDTHFAYPVGNMKTDMKENNEGALRSELLKLWRSFLQENPFGSPSDWTGHYGGEDKQPIISREDGREIIRNLSLKPFQSKYKVMIIWQPEMMHSAAANGLLKILEEPPANTVFILVSERAEQLLPTIISRTQMVMVPLLPDDEIVGELGNLKIGKEKAESIVSLADGNLNLALKLIEEEDPHHQEVFSNWMRSCFKSEFGKLVSMADEFHDKDRLYQRSFIQYALGMIRETLLSISGAQSLHRTRGGEREFIEKFKSVFTLKKLEASYQLLTDASYFLERNGSAKMIFTDLSIQFSKVLKG
jgi:DNA polymerase-3 subunit delta'